MTRGPRAPGALAGFASRKMGTSSLRPLLLSRHARPTPARGAQAHHMSL